MSDLPTMLEALEADLTARAVAARQEADSAQAVAEKVKGTRVAIQRRVEELERAYNLAAQNAAKVATEYERLAALHDRARDAMARTPPELPEAPRKAIKAIKDVPLLVQQLMAAATDIAPGDPICGVYFLLLDSEVVYVGQSVNVLARVATHATEGLKQFNRWCYIEVQRPRLCEFESFYITLLRPRFNKMGVPKLLAQNDPTLAGKVA